MSDLALEHLRHIRGRVDTISEDVKSLRDRMLAVEHHLAGFHRSDVDQTTEIAQLKVRVDRIERRLDLTP